MCEILAPAGDKNSALAAINSGADAIYLGLKQFSARSSAENFDEEQLREIINYAALFGVKVHVAMNTLVKQSEAEGFISAVKRAWELGADAIIMQDIFIGRAIHEMYPEIVLHLSTQAGVCNIYGAKLAKKFGFSRVILARETAFEDIKQIASFMETEVFVQGALCTCFSGQCYLSSFAGGNSGNRGRCKQPCRKIYSIDRKGFEEPAYRISPSDLSVGQDILKLIDAGVYSFKIEGRMRRPEYVAAAVGYYRNIIGGREGDLSALKRTYNRGNYTKGLAFGQDKSFLSPAVQGHIGEYVGTVKVVNGRFFVENSRRFVKGDGFKILRSGKEAGGGAYEGDGKGGFYIGSSARLKNGDKVFVTTDVELNSRLVSGKRLLDVHIEGEFAEGRLPKVKINGFEFEGKESLAAAENRPLSVQDIENCFKKTDKLPFEISFGEIFTDGRPYLGMGALNAFRREAYAAFVSRITFKQRENFEEQISLPAVSLSVNDKCAVICEDLRGVSADIGILKLNKFDCDVSALTSDFDGEKFIFLPPYLSGAEIEKIKPLLSFFDGIYCDGFYSIELAKQCGKKLFAGTGFNAANTFAAEYLSNNARWFCISKELTSAEAEPLCTQNSFELCEGGIKVMDILYCPFGRSCGSCDKRRVYTLTDESGRKFPLRRYETSLCRFELYNCANLLSATKMVGRLADYTLFNAAQLCKMQDSERRGALEPITKGHFSSPVL